MKNILLGFHCQYECDLGRKLWISESSGVPTFNFTLFPTAGLLGRWRQNGKSNSHLIHIMEIALNALPSFPRQPYVRLPGAFSANGSFCSTVSKVLPPDVRWRSIGNRLCLNLLLFYLQPPPSHQTTGQTNHTPTNPIVQHWRLSVVLIETRLKIRPQMR